MIIYRRMGDCLGGQSKEVSGRVGGRLDGFWIKGDQEGSDGISAGFQPTSFVLKRAQLMAQVSFLQQTRNHDSAPPGGIGSASFLAGIHFG